MGLGKIVERSVTQTTIHSGSHRWWNFSLGSILALLSLSSCAGSTSAVETVATQPMSEELRMIDLVVMRDGAGAPERDEYMAKVGPVASRHGMKVSQRYEISKRITGIGPEEVLRLNIWTVGDPNGPAEVGQDPAYRENIDFRDKIHDMSQVTLFMAKPILEGKPIASGYVLVDFVIMKSGYGMEDRHEYERRVVPVAKRYGIELTHQYEIVKSMAGSMKDKVLLLNLWSLPDPFAMKELASDPDYIANRSLRDRLHNMAELTLYLAQPHGQ